MTGGGLTACVQPGFFRPTTRGAFYLLGMLGLISCATASASRTLVLHSIPPGTFVQFGPEEESGVGSLEFLPSGEVDVSGPGATCLPEGRRHARVVEGTVSGMEVGKVVLPPWEPWLEKTDSGIRVECGDLRVTLNKGDSGVLTGYVESRVTWTSEYRSPFPSCHISDPFGPLYSYTLGQCAVFPFIPLKARVWKRNPWVLWEVGRR